MTQITAIRAKLIIASALLAASSAVALAQEEPQVVDPISGETVAISQVDFSELSRAQIREVASQLRDQGYSRRDAKSTITETILDSAEVTDPATGETVSVDEIDITELTSAERRAVSRELADQGLSRRAARTALVGNVEVTDPATGETVTLSEIDRSELTQDQRDVLREELASLDIATGDDRGPGGDLSRSGERRGPRGPGGRGAAGEVTATE